MLTGSCLCGSVRYQVDGEIEEIALCHCQQCRKAQGSAFASNAPIASQRLQFVAGADLLQEYFASALKRRVFCRVCGSPLFSQLLDRPEVLRLRIGTLDTPITCKPQYHIFCESKAEWWDIMDNLPQYATRKV